MSRCVTCRGFTLLELLVVMAIAAMLAALVRPMYAAAVPGARVKSDALNLAVSLRDARNRAIHGGRRIVVVFEPNAATYRIAGDEALELSRGTRLPSAAHDGDATREEDRFELTFYADGSSSGASVALQNSSNGYRIDVDWLTGRVRIAGANDADT